MTPIKRNEFLKPLSRDHHHGLLLCWKIRAGFKKGIQPERIKAYTDWFYKNHLLLHFEIEEQYIFTILDKDNELIKRAIAEHRRLQQLFQSPIDIQKNLGLIADELESHIRFEERVLFHEIQAVATSEQLQQIQFSHTDAKFADNQEDLFWE